LYAFLEKPQEKNSSIEIENIKKEKNSILVKFFDGIMIKIFMRKGKHVVIAGKNFNIKNQKINNSKFNNLYDLLVDALGESLYSFLQSLDFENGNVCYTCVLIHKDNRINIQHFENKLIVVAKTNLIDKTIEFNQDIIVQKENAIDKENYLQVVFDPETNNVTSVFKHLSDEMTLIKKVKNNFTNMKNVFLKNYCDGTIEKLYEAFPEYIETFNNMETQLKSVLDYSKYLYTKKNFTNEQLTVDKKYNYILKKIEKEISQNILIITPKNLNECLNTSLFSKTDINCISPLLAFEIL
jgi:hypothetical protein